MTTTVPLDGAAAELQQGIVGRVITPHDPDFDTARLAWNRIHEHRPALIVIPTSTSDVATAVRHAVRHGLEISIQATGHGVAIPARGSMLILTHALDSVQVDATTRTARFGSGVEWARVLGPATELGLAPLLGSTPHVSATGYTLGGGMGWIGRKYGLASDSVRSIEIVTADGSVRRVTPDEDADLFWALRGGGPGSLGVVTEMEIDLVPVASLYAGNLLYPASMATEVAARYRNWISDAPEELTSSIVFMNFPPLEEIPEPLRGGSFVIVRGAFTGSDADGAELLAFWRDWRPPYIDMWGRIPFSEVATISNDPVDPVSGVTATEWMRGLSDSSIEVLADAIFPASGQSRLLMTEVRHVGGAVSRPGAHPSAYSHRDQELLLEIVAMVLDPADRDHVDGSIAEVKARLAEDLTGTFYLNFLEGAERAERARDSFDAASWDRLRRIKAAYDPNNVFSHGVDIR